MIRKGSQDSMSTTTTTKTDTTAPGGALLADATRLGAVELQVTNLDRSLDFYTRVIGLTLRERDDRVAALGAGGEDLVTLHADPAARPAHGSGLYHYALLFPSREELAHAARRLAESATPIDGASDHGTHEAIYLPDPDGIGIELAADRPREQWPDLHSGALFAAGPQPLDLGALFATIGEEPTRRLADRALTMGHVHLHVGDLDAASRFYVDGLGFELMMGMPTARFVSAGGYHHHVAYNVWRGPGAPAAPAGAVGLRHWTLLTAGVDEQAAVRERLSALGVALEERVDGTLARDPFGIAVLIR
jgi:catechol 2,3-dioxygenase